MLRFVAVVGLALSAAAGQALGGSATYIFDAPKTTPAWLVATADAVIVVKVIAKKESVSLQPGGRSRIWYQAYPAEITGLITPASQPEGGGKAERLATSRPDLAVGRTIHLLVMLAEVEETGPTDFGKRTIKDGSPEDRLAKELQAVEGEGSPYGEKRHNLEIGQSILVALKGLSEKDTYCVLRHESADPKALAEWRELARQSKWTWGRVVDGLQAGLNPVGVFAIRNVGAKAVAITQPQSVYSERGEPPPVWPLCWRIVKPDGVAEKRVVDQRLTGLDSKILQPGGCGLSSAWCQGEGWWNFQPGSKIAFHYTAKTDGSCKGVPLWEGTVESPTIEVPAK